MSTCLRTGAREHCYLYLSYYKRNEALFIYRKILLLVEETKLCSNLGMTSDICFTLLCWVAAFLDRLQRRRASVIVFGGVSVRISLAQLLATCVGRDWLVPQLQIIPLCTSDDSTPVILT